MNKVVASLQDMHRKYSLEKQQFKDMELQAKVRERLQQDLGGFTDTVVSDSNVVWQRVDVQ